MWNDRNISPAKYASLVMLMIYLCVAVFLFAKLRNLDITSIVTSLVSSEKKDSNTAEKSKSPELNKETKKFLSQYTDFLTQDIDSNSTEIVRDNIFQSQGRTNDSLSELMKLDGRLAMAPAIEPYFARR